jgi:polyisoprenoid-binding protein YceI
MLEVNVRKYRSWVILLMLIFVALSAACGGGNPAAPAATLPTTAPDAAPAAAVEAIQTPAGTTDGAANTTKAPAQSAGATGSTTFVIDPTQSEVRFTLSEVLMGKPTTVVGRGNGIAGDVTVSFDDYSQSAISPIVIDATSLATDNNMRNGQIRRAILQTNNPDYHDITFTPTAVEGLPASVTVGQPFEITVTGDLTIRATTQPMTFAVTVTPVSQTAIQGSARTTLLRSDFGLEIPRVPTVADVSEEVLLEFDFVAFAQ